MASQQSTSKGFKKRQLIGHFSSGIATSVQLQFSSFSAILPLFLYA